MQVTEVPAHTGLADASIATLAGSNGFTVMVTVVEVAGLPVVHVAPEVIRHVTEFPSEGIKA